MSEYLKRTAAFASLGRTGEEAEEAKVTIDVIASIRIGEMSQILPEERGKFQKQWDYVLPLETTKNGLDSYRPPVSLQQKEQSN